MASTPGTASELAAAFDSLASRHVLLFGGKGGVGKTTISAAAALHFAATRPTILFTTDPASNLNDLALDGSLHIESLDAPALYARFLETNLPSLLEIGDRGTYLDRDEVRRFFELSLPGIDEIMAWMRIGELAEQNAESLLVVDTAPTGHTLRMLGAADHFRNFAAALDAMQAKHRVLVQQFTRRNVRDEIDGFIERFEEDARRRRELLTDAKRAAFVPVFLAEPWVIEQTRRLIGEVGIDVPFAVLNRAVQPDCDRDRQRKNAEDAMELGVPIVRAPRSCVPLDSADAIGEWMRGGQVLRSPTKAEGRATKAASPAVSPRQFLFLAGKGGVGKTTLASSIALQLARRGPVTLISVDPAHALRDVFANEEPPANLTVEMIDTRAKWRRFRDTLGEDIERAINAMTPGNFTVAYDTDALKQLIEIAPPGADELFAINRLAQLAGSDTPVVVDTAPTGHFLRLLDLPRSAGEWVREFMRILLRYREVLPAGSLGEELVEASRSLKLLEETLHSDRAAVLVVTRPERIVVAETRRLVDELRRRNIGVGAVIANYVTPESDCPCDRLMRAAEVKTLAGLGDVVTVERRDAPVTGLDDLAGLLTVD